METPCHALALSEFDHTELLAPSTYENYGLCQGYETRRNVHQDIATQASLRCRADFDQALRGFDVQDKVTYENALHGHLATLVVPLTIPQRMDLISYTVEFFCLYDDAEDSIGTEGKAVNESLLALKCLFKKLFAQYVAISPVQGLAIAKDLEAFKQMAESRKKDQVFQSFEQYREYRVDEYGSDFQLSVMMFGSDIDPMTPAERDTIGALVRLGFSTISLINDLVSFDVEYALTTDKATLVNGVYVLMNLHDIDSDEAKSMLRERCIRQDREFIRRWRELSEQGCLTDRLQKIITIVALHMAGKVVWSTSSLRYDVNYRTRSAAVNRKRNDSLIGSPNIPQHPSTNEVATASKASREVTITTIELTSARSI